jgi:hypothetical protein
MRRDVSRSAKRSTLGRPSPPGGTHAGRHSREKVGDPHPRCARDHPTGYVAKVPDLGEDPAYDF